jgi:hypothetical protein
VLKSPPIANLQNVMRHHMTTDSANNKRQKNEQKANASKKTKELQRNPQSTHGCTTFVFFQRTDQIHNPIVC